MGIHSDSNSFKVILREGEIDPEALADRYDQCIKTNQFAQARHMLDELQVLYPANDQVQHLLVAISLQQKDYNEAMGQIQSLVAKWDPERGLIDAALAVREKIDDSSLHTSLDGQVSISLCMVVKDEMAGLGACLNNAQKLADEIIVVDTGSSDRTQDIARIFGARLFNFKWENDFAAARNYALEEAAGDWVLILDADEVIASTDHDKLRTMLKKTRQKPMAFSIVTRNYTNVPNAIGWHDNDGSYRHFETGAGWFPSKKVRLFPRMDAIRFRYPVHERVDASIREMGLPVIDCPIPVHHYGYLNEVKKQEKAHRYLQLGYEKIDQFKDDLQAIRELAVQAGQLEQWPIAMELWQRFVKIKPDYAEAYVNLAGIYWQVGEYDRAMTNAKAAIGLDPDLKEAHYNLAVSLMLLGKVGESKDILEHLLKKHNGYVGARFMFAAALCFSGDTRLGVQQFRICQNELSNQAVSMAMDNLFKKLKNSHQGAFGRVLEKAIEMIN